jgi:OOP family OmpA-OmpF porin
VNSPQDSDRFSIGLKAGLNFATMKYSSSDYDYNSSTYLKTLFGLTGEYSMSKHFSIKPDMVFIGKGVNINDNVAYKMSIHAFDINLPLLYNFNIGKVKPFILAGPSFTIVRGGVITLDNYKVDISNANISGSMFGLRFGGGIKYPIPIKNIHTYLCAEVAYNYGLTNTFSSKEKSNAAIGENINPYTISGTRKPRGLEFSVSFLVPLSKPVAKKQTKQTVTVQAKDTIKPINKVNAPDKNYYSISEIKNLIENHDNVNGKKICLHTITFEFNKAILTQEAKKYLDEIISLLVKMPTIKMQINGHTDNVGISDYNLKLSKERAKSVYNYLIEKGINADRLGYDGYGDTKPIDSNKTEEGRANNRRVEFLIKE